jgi:alpha-tubulin suppressor-like RCC1 family protein
MPLIKRQHHVITALIAVLTSLFEGRAEGPYATTQPASSVRAQMATLHGMATPNGLPSIAWFEWSTNTSHISPAVIPYSHVTPAVDVGSGHTVIRVSELLTKLSVGYPYRYRLVVSNATGIAVGYEQHFVTGGTVHEITGTTTAPLGSANCVAISSSSTHNLALNTNGNVVHWGNPAASLQVPGDLTNALAIAAGPNYSLAVRNDTTVRGWGSNGWGAENPPATISNIIAVACGLYYGAGLRADGAVVVWSTIYPEFGNLPAGASNIVAIVSGLYHIVALRDDGQVFVWGQNFFGATNKPADLSNAVAIAASDYHTIALRSDGTVVAWGSDSSGNAWGQTNVPAGLNDVIAVNIGTDHGLALKQNGDFVAWGYRAGEHGYFRRCVALESGASSFLRLQSDLFPTIHTQPQSTNVTFGSSLTLQVNATALFPLSYHWEKNAVAMPGPSSESRQFAFVTREAEGAYRVVASNEFGHVTSSNAYVRVRVPQRVRLLDIVADHPLLEISDAFGGFGSNEQPATPPRDKLAGDKYDLDPRYECDRQFQQWGVAYHRASCSASAGLFPRCRKLISLTRVSNRLRRTARKSDQRRQETRRERRKGDRDQQSVHQPRGHRNDRRGGESSERPSRDHRGLSNRRRDGRAGFTRFVTHRNRASHQDPRHPRRVRPVRLPRGAPVLASRADGGQNSGSGAGIDEVTFESTSRAAVQWVRAFLLRRFWPQTNFYQRIQGFGILRCVTSKTPIGRG